MAPRADADIGTRRFHLCRTAGHARVDGRLVDADLQRSIRELRALKVYKPILITEIGFPTGPQDTRDTAAMRRDFATARHVVREEGASGMILWPFQVTPDELVGNTFAPVREPQPAR